MTLTAANAYGTAVTNVYLTIAALTITPPVVTSAATVSGTVGVTFNYQIVAGGTPTSFAASGLPAGLTVDPTTGLVSGSPTTSGTFAPIVSATNAGGTGSLTLALTVAAAPAPVLPTITSATAATTTESQPFNYQIAATNSPTSFAASGLPSGLSVDPATGVISGAPTVSGAFSVVIEAINPTGTGSATLTLTVVSALPTIDILATVPRVTAGSGDPSVITITRTGDLSQPLFVLYAIRGSAKGGTDYTVLSGRQKIRPNKASARIRIIPTGDPSLISTKVVKTKLLPSDVYQTDTVITAKVKIDPAGE